MAERRPPDFKELAYDIADRLSIDDENYTDSIDVLTYYLSKAFNAGHKEGIDTRPSVD